MSTPQQSGQTLNAGLIFYELLLSERGRWGERRLGLV